MPEYLAPAVYVEEVDTGSKPIEGVSTSTAGMIGVTERGPVNVPILITSYGEYGRWFGGRLSYADFAEHCYLPYAIEGFFVNGGKRVYVTRVLDESGAKRAAQPMFDRGSASSVSTALLRAAPEATGTAANPPGLIILGAAIADGDWVRIGTGSTAEYRRAAGAPAAETVLVPLHLPLSRTHAAGTAVKDYARQPLSGGGSYTLKDAVAAGATSIVVRGTETDINALITALSAAGSSTCVEIGGTTTTSATVGEYRFASQPSEKQADASPLTTFNLRLQLDSPLMVPRGSGEVMVRIDLSAATPGSANVVSAAAGSALAFVEAKSATTAANRLAYFTGAGEEVRRIGSVMQTVVTNGAYDDYPAGSVVRALAASVPSVSVPTGGTPTASEFAVTGSWTTRFVQGQQILVGTAGTKATVVSVDASTGKLKITPALSAAPTAGTSVQPAPKTLGVNAAANASVLALDDRMGLNAGDLLVVGTGSLAEYVTIAALPATTGSAPDAGSVVVSPALANAWAKGTTVALQTLAASASVGTALAVDAPAGTTTLFVDDTVAAASVIQVTTPGGEVTYHLTQGTPTAATPQMLTLRAPALARAHAAGSIVAGRSPLFDVQAIDAGAWGNRLRISVEDEPTGLVGRTTIATALDRKTVRLASASGVQAGTVLEFVDPVTGQTIGDPVKVNDIDRAANFTVRLASDLTDGQLAPGVLVRSREFSLTVRLLRQPDPANPARNDEVIAVETFRSLSMDPRHTNYVERAIGAIDGPPRLSDRRPEGASEYIRVKDRATTDSGRQAVRLGPETLVDVLPTGEIRPARHALESVRGDDSITTIGGDQFVGQDDPNPENRTGLQSLRNIEEVSIVAAPGQIDPQVQNALINHCELMRYRFAVLDGGGPPNDTMAAIQAQRQRYDTKYASLYHPWLLIPDPYPPTPGLLRDFAIPPSGHMVGIYARTDIERGVHKAPANEVVRGVTGLQRLLNKEQHDILNPYPVNINVIRDFRPNNRGIRVYGGRVITSDSDWKYVNVRRLLIFIEASIDRGLQWVVFEPNAEPLWARVRRSISNFLTLVWRNGGLEGTKVEEAYFVKCDRTTMTQTDIDSGRLICLVGVAPVKPAEFVIVRIGLWTAHAEQ